MAYLHIIGRLKSSLFEKIELIQLCCQSNKDFKKWYDDKFLKWDGIADYNDESVLNESITKALNELYKLEF